MSTKDTGYSNDISILFTEIAIPHNVRFWIILPFYVPSIICSFFVLYHFLVDRTSRQALHNHVIIILLLMNLIVQLTSFPWILNYYRLKYVWPQTRSFCLTWLFIDEALYITTTLLFAWATFERHILIFHDRLLGTRNKVIFVHYLPIVILLLYCISYNIIVVLVPPCKHYFDYTKVVCGSFPCSYHIRSTALWDVIVNDIIPTVIIVVCSVALLIRVLYRKSRMNQAIRWRAYRKMTIQVLSISLLYLIIYVPKMLIEFLHLCGVPDHVGAHFVAYAEFFAYYGNLLLPFVYAGSIPELQKKVWKIFPRWQRSTQVVEPQTLSYSRRTTI